MLNRTMLAVAAAAVIGAGAAAAKEAGGEQPVPQRPRRTILHFGEDDIRGGITRRTASWSRRRARSLSRAFCACAARSSIARWPLHFRAAEHSGDLMNSDRHETRRELFSFPPSSP